MKSKFIQTLFLSLCISGAYAQINAKIYYVELKEGQLIPGNPVKEYQQKVTTESEKRITVYPDIEFQTIEGIGGAFNEIGGEALMALPKEKQKEVMENLFGKKGAGFSFCRTAIGASDFGINAYSYSEVESDLDMKHFSIQREQTTVLPYIKQALIYNPKLKIFASPWSPPGWMKYSGYMDRGIEFPEKNHLKDEPSIYKAYALYFAKYIKAYAQEGINIDRLIVQNETDIHTKYPSCVMPPKQLGEFVINYLRPAFNNERIKTELWAGTFRTAQQLDAIEFVADKKFREAVDGIGIQYTNSRFISDMTSLYPGIRFMHTEGNCYNGENNIKEAFERLEEVASYINFGCPNYCYWNMILNETGESGWDWKQNSLINIDREKKIVTYNPDYAVIALLSKYLKPGATRIAGFSGSTLISVKDKGEILLFLQNESNSPETYECWIKNNKAACFEIPANSVSVVHLDGKILE